MSLSLSLSSSTPRISNFCNLVNENFLISQIMRVNCAFFLPLSQITWIPVKSFIRFVFNVHSETRAFPFDESSLAFMARFITSRLQARYDCYSSGFISLRFACHDRKTRPLTVTRVALKQDRIKESAERERSTSPALKESFSGYLAVGTINFLHGP